jgi:hypothetical protein
MGSPPPAGSKKEVLRFRSVSNIVIPPANTGNLNNNKKTVIKIAHTNNLVLSHFTLSPRKNEIVVIKLIDLMIEEAPAK